MIVQSKRYGDFGVSKFYYQVACGDLFSVLNDLENALAEGARVGVSSRMEYRDAKTFFERETSGITYTRVYNPWGTVCSGAVAEGQGKLKALNRAIQSAGGTPIAPAEKLPSEVSTVDKVLGAAKWVGIAVAITGVIYLVGPIIRAGTRRVARKIEG